MTQTTLKLIQDYLDDLDSELADLPRAARREVVAEISAHIDELRTELSNDDEAHVRELLDRVGDPADLAAEARERFGIQPHKRTWVEVTALVLLSIGGLVIPVIGWLIGVVLLWISEVWSTRDKLLGSLVIPGGIGGLWWYAQLGTYSETCINNQCTGGPSDSQRILWLVLFITLALASIATLVYLGVRMRRLTRRAVLA
jgi:HAAS